MRKWAAQVIGDNTVNLYRREGGRIRKIARVDLDQEKLVFTLSEDEMDEFDFDLVKVEDDCLMGLHDPTPATLVRGDHTDEELVEHGIYARLRAQGGSD